MTLYSPAIDFELDPEDIRSYPGALDAWTHYDSIQTAMLSLPDVWLTRLQKCVLRHMKAIFWIRTQDIPNDSTGTLTLQAISRLME